MIRGVWKKLRRIRAHTLFLLLIISLVIYCLQLPDSLAEHPEHTTGHHQGLLVTTPTNQSFPLHYLSLDSIHGRLHSTPVPALLGSRQSVSHLIGHPRRDNLFYVNNEITPGSISAGTLKGTRNTSDVNLEVHGQMPTQGDLPAHSLVTRDGQNLIVINVRLRQAWATYSLSVWLFDCRNVQHRSWRSTATPSRAGATQTDMARRHSSSPSAPHCPAPSRLADILHSRLGLQRDLCSQENSEQGQDVPERHSDIRH